MKLYKLIFKIGTKYTSEWIKNLYGERFVDDFNHVAEAYLRITLEKMHEPHVTVFPVHFALAPAYTAWYKSARLLKCDDRETEEILWKMSDSIANHIPEFLFKHFRAYYLRSMRKNGPKQKKLSDEGKAGPYDFLIDYQEIGENTFHIQVKRCALMTLAEEFEAQGIFPEVCRLSGMLAKRIGGSVRYQRLGESDVCCDYVYTVHGTWERSMGKDFRHKK